jgi:hypothetical protein
MYLRFLFLIWSIECIILQSNLDPWSFEDYDQEFTSLQKNHQQLYCMRWCPNSLFDTLDKNKHNWIEGNATWIEKYQGDIYENYGAPIYYSQSRKKTGLRCCHMCTRDCFQVVHNTSSGSFNNVSLLTFGTIDRVHALKLTIQRWNGPIVLLIYAHDYQDGKRNLNPIRKQILKNFLQEVNAYQKDVLVISYFSKAKMSYIVNIM